MKNILTSLVLLLAVSLQAQTITVDGNSLLVSENNSFPLWLASGSTISPNPPVHLLSVVEYAEVSNGEEMNLMYSGVLNITQNATVPEGKVWKVVSAMELYELGCIDPAAYNYNSQANISDESCYQVITGCMDSSSYNYITPTGDVLLDVNTDDGSCVEVVLGCTGPDHCNYNPEANTDDGSCVYPEQGYDCEGNITEYIVGTEAEGGIVFYVDVTGEHGLVAALEDLGLFEWGCYGTYISGADEQAIGTGYQNTLDIVSGCSATPIAASEALAYESEGYSDWYLPSKDELYEMYNTIGNGGSEGNIGGFQIGGFQNSYYWSSSEYSNSHAWLVRFNLGSTDYYSKNWSNPVRVRIIRAF